MGMRAWRGVLMMLYATLGAGIHLLACLGTGGCLTLEHDGGPISAVVKRSAAA